MSTIWPPYAIFVLEVSQPPHQETVIHYIAIRDCIHSHTDTPSEQLDSAPVGTLHLHCNLVIRVDLILCCQGNYKDQKIVRVLGTIQLCIMQFM